MANIVTMETAAAIWKAHREIETATKLLEELRDKKKWGADPNPLDAFGRHRQYELAVPSGDSGHRLYGLSPEMALHVIEAHVAHKQAELAEACVRANMDLGNCVSWHEDLVGSLVEFLEPYHDKDDAQIFEKLPGTEAQRVARARKLLGKIGVPL